MRQQYTAPDIATVVPAAIRANSGAWMSRTRRERLRSTLLGNEEGHIVCPRRIRIGLWFESTNPVACVESLMAEAGYRNAEQLRQDIVLPEVRLICLPQTLGVEQLNVAKSSSFEVLEQALWLGLCTAQMFDPSRPVLWTDTSLRRKLELFEPGGYYA